MNETTIFVLVSETDEVTQTISAHHKISDAASARERYIDEVHNPNEISINDRYGDGEAGNPATSLDVMDYAATEVIETLSIQPTQLS